ncbi:Kelch repeat-containing protein [Brevibacillus laterosporus]|uniref:Kelch repeat-containing protein n=1 Tax=Brevibacillus laterosporus TaxID=1465 RepID=UPI0026553351|nr:kelch repeat-containing protein [Brevibacillus laterosporus]MDN9011205.1 kelch repeat-containing protein [Brevibacillus laterosporus]MDO0942228.1 kelch repeat-containing protein [Brevibacillus laterosporus]
MNLKKIGLFAIAMIMTLFSFQTSSFAAEEIQWVKKAPMPTARYAVGGIVYDDKIYVYGGTTGMDSLDNLEVYDPAKDKWETLPSSSISRSAIAFVENQGRFYAIGGNDDDSSSTNIVEVFDPVSKKWTSAPSMPSPLRFPKAISLDNTIYTFGGFEKRDPTDLVYLFNPETNSWITKKPMPFKGSAEPFIKDNSIYVIHNDYNEEKIIIYLYDHIKDTWTQIDELPYEIGLVNSSLNFDGKIIFTTKSTLSSYDVSTKKLKTYSVPPLNRSGGAYGIVNGKLYVIGGGYDGTSGSTSDVVELNLSDLVNPDPTPDPDPTGNALLVIYMDSGLIKEFEMTNEEIRNFTEWYEGRAKGNGRKAYIVNKKYNIGPFNSRKDFISYSHIESFEVQEYSR